MATTTATTTETAATATAVNGESCGTSISPLTSPSSSPSTTSTSTSPSTSSSSSSFSAGGVRLLFLDIDGVLNTFHTPEGCLERTLVSHLVSLLTSVPHTHIILSSTWRHDPEDIATINATLTSHGLAPIHDVTPDLRGRGTRTDEILMYLHQRHQGVHVSSVPVTTTATVTGTATCTTVIQPCRIPLSSFVIVDDQHLVRYSLSSRVRPLLNSSIDLIPRLTSHHSDTQTLITSLLSRHFLRTDEAKGLTPQHVSDAQTILRDHVISAQWWTTLDTYAERWKQEQERDKHRNNDDSDEDDNDDDDDDVVALENFYADDGDGDDNEDDGNDGDDMDYTKMGRDFFTKTTMSGEDKT